MPLDPGVNWIGSTGVSPSTPIALASGTLTGLWACGHTFSVRFPNRILGGPPAAPLLGQSTVPTLNLMLELLQHCDSRHGVRRSL